MKLRTSAVVGLFLLVGNPCLRAEETSIAWDQLETAAKRYLETCVTRTERDVMAKKFTARVKGRVKDREISADEAAQNIMFDWAADHESALENREPKAVGQVCYYFVVFRKEGYAISNQIRSRLTPAIVDEIVAFLNGEADKKTVAHIVR